MSNLPDLSDKHGRKVRYLRLSVTDRCNLACFYCSDTERRHFIPHDSIVRYEHFLRLAGIAQKQGIGKIRITGGEPFARKGCMDFLKKIRKLYPGLRVAVTTNATLLEPLIKDLAALRLDSINISLDSFRPETFQRITGQNLQATVLANVERLLALGQKVKLNAVLLKGITDIEVDDFVHALREMPVDMRFIEFMPMGGQTRWTWENFLSAAAMHEKLAQKASLTPMQPDDPDHAGPARMFSCQGAKGRVGFISAVSSHFCGQCNRLRLTSDGKLRTCLFSDREYRLAPMLASAKIGDAVIARLMSRACQLKPLGNDLLRSRRNGGVAQKEMSGIGG